MRLCSVVLLTIAALAATGLSAQPGATLLEHPELTAEQDVKLDAGTVSELLVKLASDDTDEFILARSALEGMDPVPDAVIFAFAEVALNGPDDPAKHEGRRPVRGHQAAARANLAYYGEKASVVVEPVTKLLTHEIAGVRYRAMRLLLSLGEVAAKSRPEVLELVDDVDPTVQRSVIWNLKSFGFTFSEASSIFEKLLGGEDEEDKFSALRSISRYGPEGAAFAESISGCLDHDELAVAAILALTAVGADAVATNLPKLLTLRESSAYKYGSAIDEALILSAKTIASKPETMAPVYELVKATAAKDGGEALVAVYIWFLNDEQKSEIAEAIVASLDTAKSEAKALDNLGMMGAKGAAAAPALAKWLAAQTGNFNQSYAGTALERIEPSDDETFETLKQVVLADLKEFTDGKTRSPYERKQALNAMAFNQAAANELATEWLAGEDNHLKGWAIRLLAQTQEADPKVFSMVREFMHKKLDELSTASWLEGIKGQRIAYACAMILVRINPETSVEVFAGLLKPPGDEKARGLAIEVLCDLAKDHEAAVEALRYEVDGPHGLAAITALFEATGDEELLKKLGPLVTHGLLNRPSSTNREELLLHDARVFQALQYLGDRYSYDISSVLIEPVGVIETRGEFSNPENLWLIARTGRNSEACCAKIDSMLKTLLGTKKPEPHSVKLAVQALLATGGMTPETRELVLDWYGNQKHSHGIEEAKFWYELTGDKAALISRIMKDIPLSGYADIDAMKLLIELEGGVTERVNTLLKKCLIWGDRPVRKYMLELLVR